MNILDKIENNIYKKSIIDIIPLIKKRVLEHINCKTKDVDNYQYLVEQNINEIEYSKINTLSSTLKANLPLNELDLIIESFALVIISLKKKYNILLYDEQIMAAIAMCGYKKDSNVFAEIKTGEGKTYLSLLVAYYNSLKGNVHIMTSNPELAKRDYLNNKNIFELLGISVGLITNAQNIEEKKEIYKNNIIYSDSHEFVFDYLRDLNELDKERIMQNKHDTLIIDEVDNVLLDQGATPIILSGKKEPEESVDYLKSMMIDLEFFINDLDSKYLERKDSNIFLTDDGLDLFYERFNITENEVLWLTMLNFVLKANFLVNNNDEIIVKNNEKDFQILSSTTGFPLEGQEYSESLFTYAIKIHQEYITSKKLNIQNSKIKEKMYKIKLETDKLTIQEINYAKFLSIYKNFTGMSGTIIYSKDAFDFLYGVEVVDIPLHNGLKRNDNELEIFIDDREKYFRLRDIVLNEIKERPILIKAKSIDEVYKVFEFLKQMKKDGLLNCEIDLLTAENLNESKSIIDKAGRKNQITVVTDVAGRGTDIKLSPEVKEKGLCVINTNLSINRVEQQFFGRSGRQGENGISYSLTSLDESIYTKYIDYFDKYYSKKFEKTDIQDKRDKILRNFVIDVQMLEEQNIIKSITENNKIYGILYSIVDVYNKAKKDIIETNSIRIFLELNDEIDYLNTIEKNLVDKLDYKIYLPVIDEIWIEKFNYLLDILKAPKIIEIDENEYYYNLIKQTKENFNIFLQNISDLIRNNIKEDLLLFDTLNSLSYTLDDDDINYLLSNYYEVLKFNLKRSKEIDKIENIIKVLLKNKEKKEGKINYV